MPLPILPIVGGILGAGAQYLFNKKGNEDAYAQNKEFWDYTHNIQRSEAIADRDYMNQYNSPEAQMRRYKDAGLNPNLIYGQQNMMPSSRSSDGQMGNLAPTKLDLSNIGEAINTYMNVEVQKQSISNMKKQAEVMDSIKKLNENKAITELLRPGYIKSLVESADSRTKLSGQEYDQKSQLFSGQLTIQQLMMGKIRQDINTSLSTEQKNQAQKETINKLRQIQYDIMQENKKYIQAKTNGEYYKAKESQARFKTLMKEYNKVQVGLGPLGNFNLDGNIMDGIKGLFGF